MKPDPVTVCSILPACSNLKDLKSGKEIHGFAVRHGMVENLFVSNALVNLYAKCLCVSEAQAVFDLMPHQEVVSSNGVLTTYYTNRDVVSFLERVVLVLCSLWISSKGSKCFSGDGMEWGETESSDFV